MAYTLKKVVTMKRILYACDVRAMCIDHGFYTRGTNDEYTAMLEKVKADEYNVSNETLCEIADDILEHSAEEVVEDLDTESMMYILDNDVAHHTFFVREELDYA